MTRPAPQLPTVEWRFQFGYAAPRPPRLLELDSHSLWLSPAGPATPAAPSPRKVEPMEVVTGCGMIPRSLELPTCATPKYEFTFNVYIPYAILSHMSWGRKPTTRTSGQGVALHTMEAVELSPLLPQLELVRDPERMRRDWESWMPQCRIPDCSVVRVRHDPGKDDTCLVCYRLTIRQGKRTGSQILDARYYPPWRRLAQISAGKASAVGCPGIRAATVSPRPRPAGVGAMRLPMGRRISVDHVRRLRQR